MLESGSILLLGLSQYERPVLPPRAVVTTWPKMLLMAMSGSVIQTQLGSVLMFIACVITGANANHVLKSEGFAELTPPLTYWLPTLLES